MARSLNTVMLIGRLGKDAETRYTQGGTSVTTFSLATDRQWKDKSTGEWQKETQWTDCVQWAAEGVAEYLTKGKQIFVRGRLHTRSYDDRDGRKVYRTEVIVEELILLSSNDRPAAQAAAASAGAAPSPRFPDPNPATTDPSFDDDVTF